MSDPGLGPVLLSEWRKLTSTPLWWVLGLGMAAYLAFTGGVLAFSFTVAPEGSGGPAVGGVDAALGVYGIVNAIGYVFPLIIGTLVVTTELRHRTLTQSLLAEPRRGVLLTAKLLVTVPVGLLYGLLGVGGLVLASAPVLSLAGDGAYLTDPEVLRALVLGVLVTALWAVLGAAFGSVLTHQVAAIVAILAFTQFIEPIARVALGSVDGLDRVAAFLPGSAADALVGASFFGQLTDGDLLPAWGGALVLVTYVVALALVGRWTTFRRDVT